MKYSWEHYRDRAHALQQLFQLHCHSLAKLVPEDIQHGLDVGEEELDEQNQNCASLTAVLAAAQVLH